MSSPVRHASVAILIAVVAAAPGSSTEPADGTPLFEITHQIGSGNQSARGLAVQPDGRAVIAAWYTPGLEVPLLYGYLGNGTLDPDFGGGGVVADPFAAISTDHRPQAVTIDALGRIVVAGYVRTTATQRDFFVGRLLADGSPDPSFGTQGSVVVAFDLGGSNNDAPQAVEVAADGKIVVAGWASRTSSFDTDFAVARLLPSGALDTSFSFDGKAVVAFDLAPASKFDQANDVHVYSDGRILLAGWAGSHATSGYQFALARLLESGAVDPSFDGDGRLTFGLDAVGAVDDWAEALAVRPDGRIVVAGAVAATENSSYFGVYQLLPAGGFDPSFGLFHTGLFFAGLCSGCLTFHERATSVALQGDGKILIAGLAQEESIDGALARLLPNGSYDATLDGDGRRTFGFPDSDLYDLQLALGPDGRPWIASGASLPGGFGGYSLRRFASSYVFADGFEGGTIGAWTAASP